MIRIMIIIFYPQVFPSLLPSAYSFFSFFLLPLPFRRFASLSFSSYTRTFDLYYLLIFLSCLPPSKHSILTRPTSLHDLLTHLYCHPTWPVLAFPFPYLALSYMLKSGTNPLTMLLSHSLHYLLVHILLSPPSLGGETASILDDYGPSS